MGGIPRFEILDSDWENVLAEIVRAAHMIILRCDSYSPGISAEIEMIRRLGREDSTVLIQSRRSEEDDERFALTDPIIRAIEQDETGPVGGPRRPKATPPPMPPNLGFEKIIWSDEIPESALEHKVLRPLILHALESESRSLHDGISNKQKSSSALFFNWVHGLLRGQYEQQKEIVQPRNQFVSMRLASAS